MTSRAHAQTGEGPEHKPMFETKDQNPEGVGEEPILKGEFPEKRPLAWGEAHHHHSHLPEGANVASPSRLHPFKMAEGHTGVVSRRRGSRSQKGELVTEEGTGHRTDTHTHTGLNAYLLANLKDRFLKKQTKKDKIKKEIKKQKQQDGMWISR